MSNRGTKPPAVARIAPGMHLCWLYATETEHRSVVVPFVRGGLERGEGVVYIADAHEPAQILEYLADDGLATGPYVARGQLAVIGVSEAYLKETPFDPGKMIAMLREALDRATAEGYLLLRVTGEMSWALRGAPGSEKLLEYESLLNAFFPGSRCSAICQYDRRRFDVATIAGVLATHPAILVGTEIYENPHYLPAGGPARRTLSDRIVDRWIEQVVEGRRARGASPR